MEEQTSPVNVKMRKLKGKKKSRVVHVVQPKLYNSREKEEYAVFVDEVLTPGNDSIIKTGFESFAQDNLPNLFEETEEHSALFTQNAVKTLSTKRRAGNRFHNKRSEE